MPIHPQNTIVPSAFRRLAPPSLADIAGMVPPPDLQIGRPAKPRCVEGVVSLYLAGSGSLRDIAMRLGVYVLKIGTTTANPLHRVQSLSATRYAGLWGRDGALGELPGADTWELFRLRNGPAIPHEFATLSPYGHIDLRVPVTTERELVDSAINVVLEKRSLQAFLHSDEGRVRCRNANIDPDAWFWTNYADRGPAAVQEIFLFDPNRDGPWLIEVLDALGRHLHR